MPEDNPPSDTWACSTGPPSVRVHRRVV